MAIKGVIKPDHMPLNKASLQVVGLPVTLTLVKLGGIDQEIDSVEIPDRTVASGGNAKVIEFDIEIPLHHDEEVAALQLWYLEGRDPVSPTYKKPCLLSYPSLSGAKVRQYTIVGAMVSKFSLPEASMDNEGEMATVTATIKADQADLLK